MKKQILTMTLIISLLFTLTQTLVFAAPDDVITFPDHNFEKAVRDEIGKPTGAITQTDVAVVTSLNLMDNGISSLSGIEHFTALTELVCAKNQLTKLDVSKNIKLESLTCSNNQLTELDVSKNTELTSLRCSDNQLTELDVSKSTVLTLFFCDGNQLKKLDVSKNTVLRNFACGGNQLSELDVNSNVGLDAFSCVDNQLAKLDVSNNVGLRYLACSSNMLTELDLGNNTELSNFSCSNNMFKELDVSKNDKLSIFDCSFNQLLELDLSNNSVSELRCNNNQLSSLDLSTHTSLRYLNCDNNQLTQLNVGTVAYLDSICCRYNNLPDKAAITWLSAGDKSVSSISVQFYPQIKNASEIETANEWAREEVSLSVDKGFVPDDIRNNFAKVITRQEFCRMAVMLVEYALENDIDSILIEQGLSRNNNAFEDTDDPYILAAFALGITNGTKAPTEESPGVFTPDGQFSRQEAATMLMRVCAAIGREIGTPPASDFVDIGSAAEWALEGINYVYARGIMRGTSETAPTFNPKGTYTRQESIVTLNRIA